MVVEVRPADFVNIGPLMEGSAETYARLVLPSMIEGNAPARIWTERGDRPELALAWDRLHCYFLAGDPKRAPDDLACRLADTVLSEAVRQGCRSLKLVCSHSGWEDRIQRIFGTTTLQMRERMLFAPAASEMDDAEELTGADEEKASGRVIRRIDERLLNSTDLENVAFIIREIEVCWTSLNRFLEQGFGYCVIENDRIVSWCTGEYHSEVRRQIGVGIETVREAQNRGHGTRAASAFVKECRERGLSAYWDCWADNAPSWRVAEKAGFHFFSAYPAYVCEL